jgi:hypothetical protein
MARPAIWLFTLALVADAILVNGRMLIPSIWSGS